MAFEIPEKQHTAEKSFTRLLTVLNTLRENCPWDKKQTMESLRLLTIEEMYELGDAILDGDLTEVKKELGDLMMHLVFYAKIAQEQEAFDIVDVLNQVCDKLILRHPHIYGDVDAKNEEAVKKNWEKIKLKEGNKSVLAGVPNGLPALVKAYRIQEKVKGVGFDWPDSQQVWDKVEEELGEFKEAYLAPTKESINMQEAEAEFGDLLFSLVNYGRHIGINPENALERTNKKFIGRFKFMEEKTKQANEQLGDLSLEQLDSYWNEANRENRTEK